MQKLKLMHKDVLIKPRSKNEFVKTSLLLMDQKKGDDINFYEVLDVSDRVTMVKRGDVVLIEGANHTVPMLWNDERCAITSEDDIVGVIE